MTAHSRYVVHVAGGEVLVLDSFVCWRPVWRRNRTGDNGTMPPISMRGLVRLGDLEAARLEQLDRDDDNRYEGREPRAAA